MLPGARESRGVRSTAHRASCLLLGPGMGLAPICPSFHTGNVRPKDQAAPGTGPATTVPPPPTETL